MARVRTVTCSTLFVLTVYVQYNVAVATDMVVPVLELFVGSLHSRCTCSGAGSWVDSPSSMISVNPGQPGPALINAIAPLTALVTS